MPNAPAVARVAAVALWCAAVPAMALPPAWTDAERATFFASPEDPPPKELGGINDDFKGRHYTAGDEFRLHLFAPKVKDLGGGYLGVGSDQAYILIGWARSEVAWLTDYDPLVVALHRAYRVFFLHADDAQEFVRLWSADGQNDAVELVRAKLQGADAKAAIAAYRASRGLVAVRLAKIRRALKAAGAPCFLDDPAAYDHIRGLYQRDRIRALGANLLADKGIAGVAAAAKALQVQIHTLYLSNAEEYWSYTPQYRSNILALPLGERALVLRTLSGWKKNGDYCYHVQTAASYLGYLRAKVWKVFGIMRCGDKSEEASLKLLTTDRVPAAKGGAGR